MSEENLQENELTTELDSTSGGIEGTAPPEEIVTDPAHLPAETDDEKPARGKDAPITQERFDEIYGRMSRAERSLSKLTKPKEPAKAPESKPKPKEEDFENYTDFSEALTDWKYDERESKRITETNKRNQERQANEAQTTFEDNIYAAERADPEFRDKAYIHPDMVPLVYDSERFADLAYYFKDNPGETQRILSLPTANHAAREIGKIEASLGRPKPRTETKAPAATRPVGTNAKIQKKPEDMEESEYMAYRKKQLGYG